MPLYAYQARTMDGKLTKGKVKSNSEQEALSELQQLDLLVYQIKKLNPILYGEIYIGNPVKNKDFVIFLRQFATLVDAGISLVDSMEILAEQSNSKPLQNALLETRDDLREGIALSNALAKHSKIFPELLISMINAGEVSGRLDEILDRMANYYEKQHQLKKKIETALTYPIVIGVFAMLISMILLTFIVPVFTDMFLSFDQEIPAYTAFVLKISGFFQRYWWLILLVITAVVGTIGLLNKQEKFAYYFDHIKFKIPIFGSFIQKAVLARMTQTLSSLLNSSVPIIQSTEITERVITNRVVKRVLQNCKVALEEGESLAKPMVEHWVFPKLITQMIAVGEATGALDEMLLKVSDFYEQELDEASEKLKALIEPVMIVFLSFIVGAIVLAVVIPMFSLFQSF
ncbi:type II secretion system F family protein [Amphibacillus xylanus]|uniref:Type IV fimbrial assembly protein PilC n=1 Tax=Amphibacillus xylanus (strain ATCC 51415 / DSM 6626 / JCM 7361 / LMG 17667 / NBRC 15112 / Ep01) TaxID=698758 RepID=K0J209_AMPXN|nr:type II secretion system F family protein [Amphibacillus xylanus]BAM47137.1 type IV fimbrial assembly protein PilC [Amphibacillus xylanus NBRC 15112]